METSQTPHVTPFKTDNTKRRTDIYLFDCLFVFVASFYRVLPRPWKRYLEVSSTALTMKSVWVLEASFPGRSTHDETALIQN